MVATLALFWRWVRERLLSLSLSPEQELAFLEQLLPAAFLSVAAPKASTAERRREINAVAEQLAERARDGPLFESLLAHVALPARPASSRLAT